MTTTERFFPDFLNTVHARTSARRDVAEQHGKRLESDLLDHFLTVEPFKGLAERAGRAFATLLATWEGRNAANDLLVDSAICHEATACLVLVVTHADLTLQPIRWKDPRLAAARAAIYTVALLVAGDAACPNCGGLLGDKTGTFALADGDKTVCQPCARTLEQRIEQETEQLVQADHAPGEGRA